MDLSEGSKCLKTESEMGSDLLRKKVKIREMRPSDEAFIYHSWLKAFSQSNFVMGVANYRYFKRHHKVIENLLFRSDTRIACNVEDEDHVYGYIVHEGPVIHFIYVKEPFRNLGVASMLFEPFKGQQVVATHLPQRDVWLCDDCHRQRLRANIGEILLKKVGATYDPYLIWEDK